MELDPVRRDSISRRRFLSIAAATAFVSRARSILCTAAKVPIGLELYTVRDELAKDLRRTLTAVSRMGYQVVEFFSPYYDWTPDYAKEIRKLLDDLGMECRSTHNGAASFRPDGIAKAIELNQIIGSKYIVMASPGRLTTRDDWRGLAARLTAASEKLRPLGLAVGYHNHTAEWAEVEGTRPMDLLAAGTPAEVALQLDVGTCVEAGADPVKWIGANPGRVKSLHLKDWGAGEGRGHAVAFGEGDVPWKAVLDAAETTGGAEYLLIEQEVAGPAGEIAMARKCLDAYRKLRG